MRKPDRPKSGVVFRCAIYTRKSSEDGLEQEFNSRPRKLKISGNIRDDRLRAFFSSRTDIGDALTPLSVAIPAIAKTKNMRRYREDSWLRDLDSNHD